MTSNKNLAFGTSTWANEPPSEAERLKIRAERDLIKSILNDDAAEFDAKFKSVDVNYQSSGKMTPLHTAAAYGRAEMLSSLLSRKANLEAANSLGFTPLISAVYNQQEACVKTLLAACSIKTAQTKKGETSKSIAEAKNFTSISKLL